MKNYILWDKYKTDFITLAEHLHDKYHYSKVMSTGIAYRDFSELDDIMLDKDKDDSFWWGYYEWWENWIKD